MLLLLVDYANHKPCIKYKPNFKQASAFIVTYPVNNAIDKEGNDTKRVVAWEKAFIQLAKVHNSSHFLLLS